MQCNDGCAGVEQQGRLDTFSRVTNGDRHQYSVSIDCNICHKAFRIVF